MTSDLLKLTKQMPTSGLFKVLSIDMSLRAAGVCLLEKGESVTIHEAVCCKTTKQSGSRFNCFESDSFQLHQSMSAIKKIEEEHKPDAIIVEFPYISQSADAGIAIGMCWGAWNEYFSRSNFVAVEPSALKVWSRSKRGDHKEKVKLEVLNRVWLPEKKQNNDNIIDAIGLALLFLDLYNEYTLPKTYKKQTPPKTFSLDD